MPRGSSLVDDLKLAINNKRYSDVKIICQDSEATSEVLYGCKTILATRSEVLDNLLYEDGEASSQGQIQLPGIKLAAMKVILEFLYTGAIGKDALNIENVIETFYAADYFRLFDLQDTIVAFSKTLVPENGDLDLAASLLSNAAQKMGPTADNRLFKLLCKRVASAPLETITYDKLNANALEVLLQQTLNAREHFATTEYGVMRYLILWAANQVSPHAVTYFESQLPLPNNVNSVISQELQDEDDKEVDPQLIKYQSYIVATLNPMMRHIDFRLIHADILANVIEPLGIVPNEKLLKAYRFHSIHPHIVNTKRGEIFRWDRVDIGPHLIVSEDGFTVEAPPNISLHESVRAWELISDPGVHEWDIVIEENCGYAWVGVCAPGVDYSVFLGGQQGGWMVGSSGAVYNANQGKPHGPAFEKGTIVTMHLDMTSKTLSYSIDGVRQPVAFTDLPDKLYPAASLNTPGKFRLKSHV